MKKKRIAYFAFFIIVYIVFMRISTNQASPGDFNESEWRAEELDFILYVSQEKKENVPSIMFGSFVYEGKRIPVYYGTNKGLSGGEMSVFPLVENNNYPDGLENSSFIFEGYYHSTDQECIFEIIDSTLPLPEGVNQIHFKRVT